MWSRNPSEHRFRSMLKFQLAVPPDCAVLDSLQLLGGDRDVVKHCLHVRRLGEHVAHLVEKGRLSDVPGSVAGIAIGRGQPGAHAERIAEFTDVVTRDACEFEPVSEDDLGSHRLWDNETADTVESVGILGDLLGHYRAG